jgi:hypothetical protein
METRNEDDSAEHLEYRQHGHQVTISVDGEKRRVPGGEYRVSTLKTLLGVPADYELDRVVDGEFKPLANDSLIDVKEHEVFVSHVRRGGSS